MSNLNRNFSFILYPDSAPENWLTTLNDLHICYVCSPLHDKDVNADGSPKKPHYHVVLHFDGKKSLEYIKELISPFNGTIPIVVDSLKGMIRYTVHLDNPEKYQYNKDDIRSCMIDLSQFFDDKGTRNSDLLAVIDYIKTNEIYEFSDLVDLLRINGSPLVNVLLNGNTHFIESYITSRRHCHWDRISQPSVHSEIETTYNPLYPSAPFDIEKK